MMKYLLYAKNLMNNKIKIALLIDDLKIQAWQYECLRILKKYQSDKVDISHIYIKKRSFNCNKNNFNEESRNKKILSFVKKKLKIIIFFLKIKDIFYLIKKIKLFRVLLVFIQLLKNKNDLYYFFTERFLKNDISNHENNYAHFLIDIRNLIKDLEIRYLNTEETKFKDSFKKNDLEEIKYQNFDIIIRFGFRILSGEILKIPKYGVWSFHHGDPGKYRGGPAGFWETYYNEPVVGAVLQVLGEKLDAGKMLSIIYSATNKHSHVLTRNQVSWDSAQLLNLSIENLKKTGNPHVNKKEINCTGKLFRSPGRITTIIYLFKIFIRSRISNFNNHHWFLLLKKNNGKNICSQLKDLKKKDLVKVESLNNTFWADPFLFKHKEKEYIFFEEYDYSLKKGHICIAEIKNFKIENKRIIIQEKYHLSYPHIFELGGEIYCIPETSENKTLDIYRCTVFPDKWVHHHNIFSKKVCVDSTIIKKNENYFLFTTEQEEINNSLTNLTNIYFTNNIFNQWHKHPSNPISTNVKNSRSAGSIFFDEDKFFRPVQDCSQSYGSNLTIMKINKLSKTEYEEEEYISCNPKRLGYLGMHHLSYNKKYIVLDAKEYKKKI